MESSLGRRIGPVASRGPLVFDFDIRHSIFDIRYSLSRFIPRASALLVTLALALFFANCGKTAPSPSDTSPSADASPAGCVRAMAQYSSEGRAREYLDCFTGQLRTELEQTASQMKPEDFANLLRSRSAVVRGIAISDQAQTDENTARLKVEWVFEDRNEVQYFTLSRAGGTWKIAAMDSAQYNKPVVPYGTNVLE